MTEDFITDEVHRIREEILAEYDGDLRLLIADARRRTEEAVHAGRQLFSPGRTATVEQPDSRKAG